MDEMVLVSVRGTVLDRLTLDQLRMLVAVDEAGSFSAAARKLGRVQSAVSTAMANLEDELGVQVWDRSRRVATLTALGTAVLAMARRVLGEVDGLRALATGLAAGVEASVSLCVDAIVPLSALVDLCRGFAKELPAVDLRVDVQTMSAVAARVLDGSATLGVASEAGDAPGLERRPLAAIHMVPVVGRAHSLAAVRGRIASARLAEEVQIVLSERVAAGSPDRGVLSPRTWRVADLHTKRALLVAGLGWGNLPAHLVADDLRAGRLVAIRPAAWADDEHTLHLAAVFRTGASIGPAHRWVLAELERLCTRDASPAVRAPAKARRRRRTG